MATSGPNTGTTLQIRRVFQAPREKVFRAWTELQAVEQWMCRDVPSHRVSFPLFNAHAGGGYMIEVTDSKTGAEYIGNGVYREVKPPEKIVFTWKWTLKRAGGGETSLHPETEVTVEFFERGRSTEVVLTHRGFLTTKEFDETNTGWNGCFDVLVNYLATTGCTGATK
jgi:uncharacterized protein YndB with AHSA1/START domain